MYLVWSLRASPLCKTTIVRASAKGYNDVDKHQGLEVFVLTSNHKGKLEARANGLMNLNTLQNIYAIDQVIFEHLDVYSYTLYNVSQLSHLQMVSWVGVYNP